MRTSKLDSAVQASIVARLEAGATFVEAARSTGIRPETARSWLTRGRREQDGPRAEFAQAVDQARSGTVSTYVDSGPMGLEELEQVVAKAARAGSVPAMRLAWELLKDRAARDRGNLWIERARGPAGPMTFVDELAAKRSRGGT